MHAPTSHLPPCSTYGVRAQNIDTSSVPIFGVDHDSKITTWNRKISMVTGFAKEDVLGHELLSFVNAEFVDDVQRLLQAGMSGKSSEGYIFPLFNKKVRFCTRRPSTAPCAACAPLRCTLHSCEAQLTVFIS